MSEVFRAGSVLSGREAAIPVPVWVAASAIIATRLIGVLLLANELGWQEALNFVHRSAQSWDSTLLFVASQLLFFAELRCAFAALRGHNWGRWGFLAAQLLTVVYMLVASVSGFYPEIFSLNGDNPLQIARSLAASRFPDLLVVLLLFVPQSSRAFFRRPGK